MTQKSPLCIYLKEDYFHLILQSGSKYLLSNGCLPAACSKYPVMEREIDMQSREIDLGVIYILVREEALQGDELREDRWRGKE